MAPLPELLTDGGREMLGTLPPFLREDPATVAVIHCYAKEAERLEASIEYVRSQANPLTASFWGLTAWARVLRVPVDPSALLEGFREVIVRRQRSLQNDPAGAAWVLRVSRRIGDVPWTYEEHVDGDAGSPPARVLRIRLPYDASSLAWDNALRAFRDETPSELGLVFVSAGGFILDESQMDLEGMGI